MGENYVKIDKYELSFMREKMLSVIQHHNHV